MNVAEMSIQQPQPEDDKVVEIEFADSPASSRQELPPDEEEVESDDSVSSDFSSSAPPIKEGEHEDEKSRQETSSEEKEKYACKYTSKKVYRRRGKKGARDDDHVVSGATCRAEQGIGCCLDYPWNKRCTWDSNYTSSPAKCLWDEKITL